MRDLVDSYHSWRFGRDELPVGGFGEVQTYLQAMNQ